MFALSFVILFVCFLTSYSSLMSELEYAGTGLIELSLHVALFLDVRDLMNPLFLVVLQYLGTRSTLDWDLTTLFSF